MVDEGTLTEAKQKIEGGRSVLHAAVVLALSPEGAAMPARYKVATKFVSGAFAYSKFVG